MPDNKTVTFDAPTRERLRALVIKHGGPTECSGWCVNESGLDDLLREFLTVPKPAAQSAGQEPVHVAELHLDGETREIEWTGGDQHCRTAPTTYCWYRRTPRP